MLFINKAVCSQSKAPETSGLSQDFGSLWINLLKTLSIFLSKQLKKKYLRVAVQGIMMMCSLAEWLFPELLLKVNINVNKNVFAFFSGPQLDQLPHNLLSVGTWCWDFTCYFFLCLSLLNWKVYFQSSGVLFAISPCGCLLFFFCYLIFSYKMIASWIASYP